MNAEQRKTLEEHSEHLTNKGYVEIPRSITAALAEIDRLTKEREVLVRGWIAQNILNSDRGEMLLSGRSRLQLQLDAALELIK